MAKKILVVDDEVDVLEVVKARLSANNYEVITAQTGALALALAEREKPDLIILDIMMPQMDGYTTLRELRKNITTANTPVIILSVKEKNKMEDILYFQNISEYLEKPFDGEQLLNKVKKVLGEP